MVQGSGLNHMPSLLASDVSTSPVSVIATLVSAPTVTVLANSRWTVSSCGHNLTAFYTCSHNTHLASCSS